MRWPTESLSHGCSALHLPAFTYIIFLSPISNRIRTIRRSHGDLVKSELWSITLAGSLYEGFRLARESAGRQHNEDFFLSNCQFMSVISDMGQDAGASLLSCYSTRGAHVLLCSLYSFSHIHNLTQRMLLAPVRLNVPILEVCHNVHLPRWTSCTHPHRNNPPEKIRPAKSCLSQGTIWLLERNRYL